LDPITMQTLSLLLASLELCAALSLGVSSGSVRSISRPTLRRSQCTMQGAVEEEEADLSEAEKARLARKGAPEQLSTDAKKVFNNLRSEAGVEFAPWMQLDPEEVARVERERAKRLAKGAESAQNIGAMVSDPQAAEVGAGGGLKSKVLSEEEVELRWATADEGDNKGFVIQRRKGGSSNFEPLASFETFAPLRSKGPDGGSYVYLDDTVPDVGTWVYRVLDCDASGNQQSVCQKLVEIESSKEQTQTLIVGGVIFGLALVFVAAGLLIDPLQTTGGF